MIKVGFLTTVGYNIGDEFIRHGIRGILNHLGISYSPLYVNKVNRASLFTPLLDEDSLESDKFFASDLFIQSGAPVYWNLTGDANSLTSEWHKWIWGNRILATDESTGPIFANLGAGSCQRWGASAADFLSNRDCAAFAFQAYQRARLTTVRDPIAKEILGTLECNAEALVCPAFLAGAQSHHSLARSSLIGVNLMELGGHYDLDGIYSSHSWAARIQVILAGLRKLGKLCFIAHDAREVAFQHSFLQTGERVFFSQAWKDYLEIYSACSIVVANRVHGAVVAAGFGVPSIILGLDTRAQIGDFIGLPRFHSHLAAEDEIIEQAAKTLSRRKEESARLRDLQKMSIERYTDLLSPVVNEAVRRASAHIRATPAPNGVASPRLASVEELESPRFKAFMSEMNQFAVRKGLREFTNWSKVWEYPWLWENGLAQFNWSQLRVIDLGSEISPFPWFLAELGAKVTLVEFDRQWQGTWEKLSHQCANRVDWRIVDSESIPLEDNSADIVTSFSVIEHQPNKRKAIDEVVRVLKPGGYFALSFDICEQELGMTFPAWNGHALSLREFEEIVWRHPAFKNSGHVSWNVENMEGFRKWNLLSAPHHNYVVGAAILRKAAE